MKKFLFFFFVVFFAFPLTESKAQNKADHNVTIEVDRINSLKVVNDVTVNVNELNGDITDAPTSTTTLEVATNENSDKIITAEITENEGDLTDEIDLQVSLIGVTGRVYGYQDITNNGSPRVAEDFKQIDEDGTLKYRATATPEFDPSNDEKVEVLYTLTNQ